MSDAIEPIEPEPVTADEPAVIEQVDPDTFAAITSELGDVAAAAAAAEAEHSQEVEVICEGAAVIVESEYAPRYMAWQEISAHFDDAIEVADCLMEIDMGSDCDHVTDGVECPVASMTEHEREKRAHFMTCAGCMANLSVDVAWEYALAQEVSDVVKHLMAQRIRAKSDGEDDVVLMLDEVIDNVINGRHRSA